jgi:hypothetical protein
MRTLTPRRQYNTAIFYIGVQRISGANIQTTAEGPGKYDLSFGGNSGLHGKTILPLSKPYGNAFRPVCSFVASVVKKRILHHRGPRRATKDARPIRQIPLQQIE